MRVIHFIVALRKAHPNKKIFISKFDFSDAHRRVTHSARSAVQSIVIFRDIAYLALRMTFGGSANPPAWCGYSEMVTDLSNELPLCGDWDPSHLRSPLDNSEVEYKTLPDDIQMAEAKDLSVHIPTAITNRADCFIGLVWEMEAVEV